MEKCLCNSFCQRKVPLWQQGNKFLFIGEAPGATEDREGRPFCGSSGKLLQKIISHAGIISFSLTNVLKCRPPKNRKPTYQEIINCSSFLQEDMKKINPQIIVLVGKTAQEAFSFLFQINMQRYEIYQEKMMIYGYIYHPAFLLYTHSQEEERKTIDFLRKLNEDF